MGTPEETKALKDGMLYVATTPINSLTLAVAGTGRLLTTIKNPTASGFRIIVSRMIYFSQTNIQPAMSTVFVGMPENTSLTQITPINLNIGSSKNDTTTVFRSQFGNLSAFATGGAQSPFELPTGNGDDILNVPFIVMPGQIVGFDFNRPVVLGTAMNMYLMVYYYLEAI
jgi:hypothetical protein